MILFASLLVRAFLLSALTTAHAPLDTRAAIRPGIFIFRGRLVDFLVDFLTIIGSPTKRRNSGILDDSYAVKAAGKEKLQKRFLVSTEDLTSYDAVMSYAVTGHSSQLLCVGSRSSNTASRHELWCLCNDHLLFHRSHIARPIFCSLSRRDSVQRGPA